MRSESIASLRWLDDRLLERHPGLYGHTAADRAVAFTRALATSPIWARLRGGAVLVVRPHPVPIMAVFGAVAPDERPLLDALGWHADELIRRLRPVTYADAERGCEVLATQLRDRFSEDVLAASSLVGIPRGGQIVASMLAYALGLPSERVGVPPARGGQLLLVDDCVLSGSRLARWLAANPGPPIVAVHLASVAACREAIVAHHPRVTDCLAALDLTDHAPQDEGWHERWQARAPDDLWTGDPDHVVFPWNEPDSGVWNAERGRTELGWHVVPPSWCLKNRTMGGGAPGEVQVNTTGADGPHSPAETVLWAELDGATVVANAGDQRAIRLTGVAADCWHGLVQYGRAEVASDAVAATYDAPHDIVRADVARLVERLAGRGLLQSS